MSALADERAWHYPEAAPLYRAAGWNPLPLPAGAKWPPPKGFTGDGPDPSEYDYERWMALHRNNNLGVRLSDDVIGIDVDRHGDKDGVTTLHELEDKLGKLPATWRSTARHDDPEAGIRYYRVPKGSRLRKSIDKDIDLIRRGHRYGASWPSVHPDLGTVYGWYRPEGSLGESGVIPRVDELPMLPDAWLDFLRDDSSPRDSSTPRVVASDDALTQWESVPDAPMCARVARDLKTALVEVPSGARGSRHDTFMSWCGTFANHLVNGHDGVRGAVATLWAAFTASIADRSTPEQADAEARSAWAYALGEVSSSSRADQDPCALEAENRGWTDELHAQQLARALQATPAAQEMLPVTPRAQGGAGDVPGGSGLLRARLLSRAGLRSLPTPSPLIDNVLDLGTVALLGGYWGTCKSFIAQDWAACVATGKAWQGRAVEQRRVLYVAAEGAHGMDQRLNAWETAWRRPIAEDDFYVLPDPVQLVTSGQQLAELVHSEGFGMVVVDTLSRCSVGLDENSAKDMGRVVHTLYELQQATRDGTVLVVHHTGKDRKTIRGSSAIESGVDTVYLTDGDPKQLKLTRDKRKDGPKDDVHTLQLELVKGTESAVISAHVSLDISSPARALLSTFVSNFSSTGASRADLRKAADVASSTFFRAVNVLVKDGYLINSGTESRPFYRLNGNRTEPECPSVQ